MSGEKHFCPGPVKAYLGEKVAAVFPLTHSLPQNLPHSILPFLLPLLVAVWQTWFVIRYAVGKAKNAGS